MQCTECETQLPVGAAYCPKCGSVTPYHTSSSGVSPSDATFISHHASSPQYPPSYTSATPAPQNSYPAPPLQNPYATPPPPGYPYNPPNSLPQAMYQPPQVTPPEHNRKALLLPLSVGIALLLIIAGSAALFLQNKNAEYQKTVATQTADANIAAAKAAATQTAAAIATTTQLAQKNPYDPAMQALQYTFFAPSANAPTGWQSDSNCVISSDGTTYTVSSSPGKLGSCVYSSPPTNYTLEMHMQYHGDTNSGGLEVRQTQNKVVMLYLQKDLVGLQAFDSQANKTILIKEANAPIKPDTDLLIGVVADASKIIVSVNKTVALSVDDKSYDIGQSQYLSLLAIDNNQANSGKVTYQKVRIWTA